MNTIGSNYVIYVGLGQDSSQEVVTASNNERNLFGLRTQDVQQDKKVTEALDQLQQAIKNKKLNEPLDLGGIDLSAFRRGLKTDRDKTVNLEELIIKMGGSLNPLKGASLCEADLSGADLSGADLRGANLVGAYLVGANLCGAYLCLAYLTVAKLRGANLFGANLTRADLTRANLSVANLTEADLRGADLRGADLTGAQIVKDRNTITGEELRKYLLETFEGIVIDQSTRF